MVNKNLYDMAVAGHKHCYKGLPVLSGFQNITYYHPNMKNFNPKSHMVAFPYGGGMDSYIVYKYAQLKGYDKNMKIYHLDYGQKYMDVERDSMERLLGKDAFETVKLDLYQPTKEEEADWGEMFPGRNWIIATYMGMKLQDSNSLSGEIWMNAVSGEQKIVWGDKSEEYFREGSRILTNAHNMHIILRSPVGHLTKGMMVAWYRRNFPKEMDKLLSTVTCHEITKPGETFCGECLGCAHRWCGMIVNGIVEKHKVNPFEFALEHYTPTLRNPEFSERTPERIEEIKYAIKGIRLYDSNGKRYPLVQSI